MYNYIPSVELTKEFKTELSKNFCAMKYYHQQSDYKKLVIAQKAREMDEQQLKEYVTELGNII